jgi:hypothetical protein
MNKLNLTKPLELIYMSYSHFTKIHIQIVLRNQPKKRELTNVTMIKVNSGIVCIFGSYTCKIQVENNSYKLHNESIKLTKAGLTTYFTLLIIQTDQNSSQNFLDRLVCQGHIWKLLEHYHSQ